MTRIGNIPAKSSIREHLPSAPAEVATPKKKAGNSSARMLTERKANGEVSRGEPARPSQSELFTEIHSFPDAQSAKRCVRCLLYTSDAADEEDSVDLGGRRII